MVLCCAFGCLHYNERDNCKFYRFPKELKQKKCWIKLLRFVYLRRRIDEPGPGARICSCHFKDGKKNNGPTILLHRPHHFIPHHLTPEKKKKRSSTRKKIIMPDDSNILDDHSLYHESISETNTINDISDEPLKSSSNLSVQSKNHNVNSSIVVDAENYFLQKENEELKLKLNNLAIAFTYENLSQNDDLINSYTGLPSNAVFMALYNLVKNVEFNYYLKWTVETIKFNSWLKEYESNNKCEYVLQTGKKKSKDGHRSYYECGRTGVHKEIVSSKRSKKSQGSKQININCTSHLILFEHLNKSSCHVIFYKYHYGHQESELQHISLPITKKHEIAVKLSQGVTMERKLDNVRGNIGSILKREDLITRADLHNIKQKYTITIQDGQLHKNDATIVDIWVEQMKQEGENNPVIYYKKQGEVDGNNILDLKDFCIILMDPSQMHMLKQFGHGKISMCDENEFNNALKESNQELMNDPDTKDFGIYFDRMYGNRTVLQTKNLSLEEEIENLKQKFAVSQCESNALTQTSSNIDTVCEKVEGLVIDTATYSDPDISHISYSEKCDEWWCPKHSDFNEILKKISLKEQSLENRYLVRKAKARHTYWQGEKNKNTPRCPMQDNKKGTPNHYQVPSFWPSPLQ
ncbi:hypothetical protein ACI65C_013421 [Semiaphis heraclei]